MSNSPYRLTSVCTLCNDLGMSDVLEMIGSREACKILDVDKSTLSRWVAAGRVRPAQKLPGRNGALLFHAADIDALAAARKKASA